MVKLTPIVPSFKLNKVVFFIGFAIVLNASIHFGVREKTWFEKFFDILAGGGGGAIAGTIIAIVYGGFGVVSGTISLGVGFVGLVLGGIVGGLGLGSIFHIILNSDDYVYDWPIIWITLIVGTFASWLFAWQLAETLRRSTRR